MSTLSVLFALSNKRDIPERGRRWERGMVASFLPNYAKSSLQAAGAKAHLSQLSRG